MHHDKPSVLRLGAALMAGALALTVLGCAPGAIKRRPPIHPNWNMDDLNDAGQRFDAQEPNAFFADGRSMRPRVEGTVPRGSLHEDPHRFEGKDAEGNWAETLPEGMTLDQPLLLRGRGRFQIYCSPCHGNGGTGDGSVVKRGFFPPPSFHDPALRAREVGYFFNVITNGIRNMPAYGPQVPVEDRWAIAAYLRALQLSRGAELGDVPPAIRQSRGW